MKICSRCINHTDKELRSTKNKGVTQFCAAICVTPLKKLRGRAKKSDFEACSKPPEKYDEKTKIKPLGKCPTALFGLSDTT